MTPLLRDARPEDLPAITAIYAHHVRSGTASFETEPPDESEMRERFEAIRSKGLPWLVAELGGRVAGYAYAGPYRARLAYRFTLEDSIYVDPACVRAGVGRALLARLIADCEAAGARQLVAVIGGSDNEASIRLHAGLGFRPVGILRAAGWKHGRWVDSVLMQREIGKGSGAPP
ncbi:MAG: N-acetyltransferase [Betaproteobacteria bacterium]|nr:N-acetyltransferase [Betaproteobacteria bacterium]